MSALEMILAAPDIETLKNNKKKLTDEERDEVMKAGAVWHHGPNGEETPAVQKAVVDGKEWFWCATHRAGQVKPTLKGAIKAYDFIKTTASMTPTIEMILAANKSTAAGKYDHIEFKPTPQMSSNAARGLELRNKLKRGGTEVGVARARDLVNKKHLSPSTVRRMKAYFDRHQSDDLKYKGDDSTAGYIAWMLWGGDAGWSWAKKICRQMDAADKK